MTIYKKASYRDKIFYKYNKFVQKCHHVNTCKQNIVPCFDCDLQIFCDVCFLLQSSNKFIGVINQRKVTKNRQKIIFDI